MSPGTRRPPTPSDWANASTRTAGCLPKPNGNMRPEPRRARPIPGATMSVKPGRIAPAVAVPGITISRLRSEVFQPMPGVSTTRRATCGNGPAPNGASSLMGASSNVPIRKVRWPGWCAAGPGAAILSSRARPVATTTVHPTATATSVFGCCVRPPSNRRTLDRGALEFGVRGRLG